MRRRQLLTGFTAGLLGTAGCLGSTRRSGQRRSETTETTATPAPDPSPTDSVRVQFERVQPSVVRLVTDRLEVRSTDRRYLSVRLDAGADAVPRDVVTVRLNGERYTPMPTRGLYRSRVEEPYTASLGRGWLVYELPPVETVSEARLTTPNARWPLPSRIRRRLTTEPPTVEVAAEFPSELGTDRAPSIAVSLTNRTDRFARFVGGLTRSGPDIASIPVASVVEPVPAGETVELTIREEPLSPDDRSIVGDGKSDLRYTFDWSAETIGREIELVE